MKDVHTEHCCIRHGCKYGDNDCTVTTEKSPQSFPCEWCDPYEEDKIALIVSYLDRGNDVREWPEDEAAEHRNYMNEPRPETGLYGSFEDRHQHVLRFRAAKLLKELESLDMRA